MCTEAGLLICNLFCRLFSVDTFERGPDINCISISMNVPKENSKVYQALINNFPNQQSLSQSNDDDEEPTCEMEVINLPFNQPSEKIKIRLKRLADNCGGKVLRIVANKATLRFPTPDHASRYEYCLLKLFFFIYTSKNTSNWYSYK